MKLLITILITTGLWAADDIKLKAAEQETRFAKLEALVLREQIAMDQLSKVRADAQALSMELCKAAGIDADPKACQIDLNAKTATKRPAEPKKD